MSRLSAMVSRNYEFTQGRDGASYFIQRGTQIIILLIGGSKRTQKQDIKRAKVLAAHLD